MRKGVDVLSAIDDVLADQRVIELDAMLDVVFPPGEVRNARRWDHPRWDDFIPPGEVPNAGRWDDSVPPEEPGQVDEDGEIEFRPMVDDYVMGDDLEGEGPGFTADDLGLLEDATLEPFWRLGRIGRSPRQGDWTVVSDFAFVGDWYRLSPGQMWVGRFASYDVGPRPRVDAAWLAEEDRWLAEHSQP